MVAKLYLNDLLKYKKEDLQKLASDMGLATSGTVKELAERIAAVEVEVEDQEPAAEKVAASVSEADTNKVSLKVVKVYHDLQLKRVMNKGELLEVDKARADHLLEIGYVEKM